jgi:hypothetical protein
LNFFLERRAAADRGELDAFVVAAKSGGDPSLDGEDGLKANPRPTPPAFPGGPNSAS